VVDYEQVELRALPQPGRPTPEPLPVDGSLAGRVFTRVRAVEAGDGDARRWWAPMVDGTDRLGVVEFAGDPPSDVQPGVLRGCELVAGLAGHLMAGTAVRGDLLEQARRTRPMSTAAELLWQLLPPLTASSAQAVVSAILQPCYEVGGDGFDYAFDGPVLHLAILDAAGRGLEGGVVGAVALSAVRAARRAGRGLYDQARAADAALTKQFPDSRFATAVLAELDMDTGRVRYLNAGHPAPLVLRGGRVARELGNGRRMPLGLDDPLVEIGEELLEPHDRLLFYTDGVTEAQTPAGDRFGVERLADLAERHADAGLPAPETLRRLAHAVLEHQAGEPADDATLMLVQWSAAAALNTVPQVAEEESS
jgi:serine phosphatase RsbU (regulator of sigma subunit)